ncbi:hypothetical protein SERLADRAFT_399098 [Serpula lacrymans var. lacrymans S7.9]|nr:uncharacterized protein SERLADRAFT_399098 [Serpula lacrymans var. lacrymans S7.9]EGO21380.1 hypothetical protein SERLADRAFT_399098 [Serpula lacrymans var. lacrymans S7.9]
MAYTQEKFNQDLAKIAELASPAKPTDIYYKIQWEMARTHKCLIDYWVQVQKEFDTSAPVDDAENYLGYAKQWVRMIEVHHQLEEEVQFPCWDAHLNSEMVKNHDEHVELMGTLSGFKNYLEAVSSGAEAWSGSKAKELSQAFLPTLMHHFVEELYTLDPDLLKNSGFTVDELKVGTQGVSERSKTLLNPFTDVVPCITHNGGALDWPPVPWEMTAEFKMPPQLYETHKGWWKYSAYPLSG